MKGSYRRIAGAVCALFIAFAAPARAGQQQWSNAYVNWTTGSSPAAISTIDQEMWILAPANGTQWVMQFSWTEDPAHGGYLGFNRDAQGNSQMIYSLWDATAARAGPGAKCTVFGGEGSGMSCRQPYSLRADRWYRLHLEKTTGDAGATWWAATISEETASGAAAPVYLGKLAMDPRLTSIAGNSIANFIEYFGDAVPQCGQVPVSAFYVSQPQLNWMPAASQYEYTANLKAFTPTDYCKRPTDPQGASALGGDLGASSDDWWSLYPFPPTGSGVMVFLGGNVIADATLRQAFDALSPAAVTPPTTHLYWSPMPEVAVDASTEASEGAAPPDAAKNGDDKDDESPRRQVPPSSDPPPATPSPDAAATSPKAPSAM
ncbi:DUF3472 domain-containing protein [Lysobacter hankyongensis]|uniref:DUF3472 domain-containing protein n=1 Tax=Lysobacter hankyongensis TaxID=1176535 RepID=A0ABP9BS12_9GAMM